VGDKQGKAIEKNKSDKKAIQTNTAQAACVLQMEKGVACITKESD